MHQWSKKENTIKIKCKFRKLKKGLDYKKTWQQNEVDRRYDQTDSFRREGERCNWGGATECYGATNLLNLGTQMTFCYSLTDTYVLQTILHVRIKNELRMHIQTLSTAQYSWLIIIGSCLKWQLYVWNDQEFLEGWDSVWPMAIGQRLHVYILGILSIKP